MIRKLVLGAMLVGLIAILVGGAVIRTVDKTANAAEAQGAGEGQGEAHAEDGGAPEKDCDGEPSAVNEQEQSAKGREAGSGEAGAQYPNYDDTAVEMVALQGTVAQAPADGADLVILTEDGQEVSVGTGPGYLESQGYALQEGEGIRVEGYWEDGELKAARLTRQRDGQTVTLRDQYGRPAWAGQGRRAAEQGATAGSVAENDAGSGASAEGSSANQGQAQGALGRGGKGRSSEGAAGDGAGGGESQADAGQWTSTEGSVVVVEPATLLILTDDGQEIAVAGRAWSFAQEQGFTAQTGDRVSVAGFYEGEEYVVGQIHDATNGLSVLLREPTGRPMWAGRGGRGG